MPGTGPSERLRILVAILCFASAGAARAQDAPAAASRTPYQHYLDFKKTLASDYNLEFSMLVSGYVQSGTPRGGPPVIQAVYSPSVAWRPFHDTDFGSGRFIVSIQYHTFLTSATTSSQQVRMGIVEVPNGWTTAGRPSDQISYTHTMPGGWGWLSLTIGQYAISTFDDNHLAQGAQTSFLGAALAQNGSGMYPSAGIGGYAQADFQAGNLRFAGGFQSATDVNADSVTTHGFSSGRYAYFAAVEWRPDFLPGGTYSLLWYSQPSISYLYSGASGLSFSAAQGIGESLGVFLRVNGATGTTTQVRASVGAGAVYKDPFGRDRRDQFGIGLFWNHINKNAYAVPTRSYEWGSEMYYTSRPNP